AARPPGPATAAPREPEPPGRRGLIGSQPGRRLAAPPGDHPPGSAAAHELVFVPRLELTSNLLGLDTAVARAVPGDLLVALASRLVPADLVQKLILLGIVVAAGTGAARLTPTHRPAARAAAAALYAWNPFVYERLVMGHWGLLVAYATLPFVARAASDLRTGTPGSVRRLVLTRPLAAAPSPPGGLIAAAVALCVTAAPPWSPAGTGGGREEISREVAASTGGLPGPGAGGGRGNPTGWGVVDSRPRVGLVVGVGLAVNAPWLVPSVLRPGGVPVRAEGAAAFASRPDGPLGTVGSLVGLGGIWN